MFRKSITLCLALVYFVNLYGQNDSFEYTNKTYDDNIRTVQLYPGAAVSVPNAQLLSPVIGLRSTQTLLLEFDELYQEAYTYQAKIIHCNANWQPSGLSPLQYLTDYNEFVISDAEYSFGTIIPYVHYTFELPKPTVSGNFLLVVYADGDPEDVIITRRFMVFENAVSISGEAEIRNRAGYNLGKQDILFDVSYGRFDLIDPMNTTSVTIVQNQRWDNAKVEVKPTFVKDSQRILEYNHFAGATTFDAGNEFRQFDIRSLKYFGFHVATVKFEKDHIDAWVEQDMPRNTLAFTVEQNNNGQFFIENTERKIADIENDYATVYFELKAEQGKESVFLSGAFTNWNFDEESRLRYNPATGTYQGKYLLKQGLYDYQYLSSIATNANYYEGNKNDTRNTYEIFVYYRSQSLMADLLIGYQRVRMGGL